MSRRRFHLPPTSAPARDAFVLVPLSCLPPQTPQERANQQALYEWARAQAEAVVRPSVLERDLLGGWN